jgi:hypothetical protein
MWTLHDFPAYGLISGLTTKGFKGCLVCGPHTVSRRSKILRKNVYCSCHRRYLPENHYFRGVAAAFDGEASHETEAEPLTGNQTIRCGAQSEAYIDGGGTEKDDEFPAKEHGVKRISALYQLSYWRVSIANMSLLIVLVLFERDNMAVAYLLSIVVILIQSRMLVGSPGCQQSPWSFLVTLACLIAESGNAKTNYAMQTM